MASYTSTLDLYKIDPLDDGNSTFNLETMLNDNWEKIDTKYAEQDMVVKRNSEQTVSNHNKSTILSTIHRATGTTNLTITTNANFTYLDHSIIKIEITSTQTGDITINIDSQGAKAIYDVDNTRITSLTKGTYEIYYDESNDFFVQRPNGIGKKKERENLRKIANLSAVADIYDNRTVGASGVWYDLLDGTNDYSKGQLDTTKTTATVALNVGETVLTDKVVSTEGFKVGQEITVQDDTNKECVNVTKVDVVEETVVDKTAPVSVIDSAYTTSANARPQILENGWIVTCVYDNTGSRPIKMHISKDNGATWELFMVLDTHLTEIPYFSIVSKGDKLHLIVSASNTVRYILLDVNQTYTLDGSFDFSTSGSLMQNIVYGNGVSVDISQDGTKICATWSAKTSAYPNSFNIFVRQGTINADGNITWGSVEQLTTDSSTGSDYKSPCVTYTSNNQPMVTSAQNANGSTLFIIATHIYNGGSWSRNTIKNEGAYRQYDSSAVVQKHGNNVGRIWIVWYGFTQAITNRTNIKAMYSDDNGLSWIDGGVEEKQITSASTYQSSPTISEDINGNIYIAWTGQKTGDNYNIRLIKHTDTWGDIEEVAIGNGNDMLYPSMCDNYNNFEKPIMIWKDTENSRVAFYGKYTIAQLTKHLETTPLTLPYKKNALIYRSNVDIDEEAKTMKVGVYGDKESYDHLTPVSVVDSSHSTDANAKPIVLSNGWIVVSVTDGAGIVRLYVSKDGGATWSQLCYANIGQGLYNASMVSVGNMIYLVVSISAIFQCKYVAIDAEAQADVDINDQLVNISVPVTGVPNIAIQRCGIATNHNNTKICATWVAQTTTHPNTFNIFARQGTIGDDGIVTWGDVEQLNTANHSVIQYKEVSVSYIDGDKIMIPYLYMSNGAYRIYVRVYDGASWSAHSIFYGGALAQAFPQAIVQKYGAHIGRIWCVWHGVLTGYVDSNNILIAYSDDNGNTWVNSGINGVLLAYGTNREERPTITEDISGNIYVVWVGATNTSSSQRQVKIIKRTGDTWGGIEVITNNTTEDMIVPSVCGNNNNFEKPITIWQDRVNSRVAFYGKYTIGEDIPLLSSDARYNITPTLPTNEIVAWVDHEDTDLTIDGEVSIVNTGQADSYIPMTKHTNDLGDTHEDEFVGVASTKGDNVNVKLTLTRTSTDTQSAVTKILGAIGE